MTNERADFVWKLQLKEILQTEELKAVDEYIEELQNQGKATLEHAKIFAVAMLEWHLHIEEAIIEVLSKSKKK